MLKIQKILAHRKLAIVLALSAGMVGAVPLAASTLEIQFSGLDIVYDGSDIFNKDPGGGAPDLLNTVTFVLDGGVVGSLMTDISIDMFIPGVTGIDVGGDSVLSASGGVMDLNFGGGDFIGLDLDEVSVAYLDILGVSQFSFGASIASIDSQSLPFGLELGEPVSVSFSAQINSSTLTDDKTVITGYEASGTGQVEGIVVPEPTTLALGMLSLTAISVSSFRKANRK